MLARSFGRVAASSSRQLRGGARLCASSLVEGCHSPPYSTASSTVRRCRPSGWCVALLPQQAIGGRYLSSSRPPTDEGEDENDVDVTPVGDKPGQITREAIAEAEAADDIGDVDGIDAGDPSEWEFDASTEEAFNADGDNENNENPPTPILDAYERSRDPVEMERLIKLSFDSLPERAGPQRYNHKRREHQRYKTIRNIKYKERAQRMAAHDRKLQKSRDRKARDLALFATWRGTDGDSAAVADAKQ